MKSTHRLSVIAAAFVVFVSLARGQEMAPDGSVRAEGIANWPAPDFWEPPALGRPAGQVGILSSTSPLPFIAITPCRLVDTRPGSGFPAAWGPPALIANATRDFDLNSAPHCPEVSGTARAYSLNVTVTETQGPGDIRIWPTGSFALVSTQNWGTAGVTLANAAVVPAGTSGSITVQVAGSGTHLIVDINGYYAPAGVGAANTFVGLNAGNFTMTGDFNAGFGSNALFSNTTGHDNTAIGNFALHNNTTGVFNTATGAAALGNSTTALGNTAAGGFALTSNTVGNDNTGTGYAALGSNTAGNDNTAIGGFALNHNTTGNGNIGIGFGGGFNLTTGGNNICIGNEGVAGESNTIRIGDPEVNTASFIAGIYGTSVTGVPVLVSSSGQLGVASSSRYVKENIRKIAEESDGLMKLRPVAFKYTPQIDPKGLAQYGLIAEEVADVYPELVAYDRDGRPETVRYHLVNALLLNEVQKQHRTVEAQEKTIEQQKATIDHEHAEIEALKTRLSRLEARLLADSRP